jgi:hypothetical protein
LAEYIFIKDKRLILLDKKKKNRSFAGNFSLISHLFADFSRRRPASVPARCRLPSRGMPVVTAHIKEPEAGGSGQGPENKFVLQHRLYNK